MILSYADLTEEERRAQRLAALERTVWVNPAVPPRDVPGDGEEGDVCGEFEPKVEKEKRKLTAKEREFLCLFACGVVLLAAWVVVLGVPWWMAALGVPLMVAPAILDTVRRWWRR